MNKKILVTVLFAIVAMTGRAQGIMQSDSPLSGSWVGKLDAGAVKLTLVLHIADDAKGNVVCTLDSPDQGVKGIPAKTEYASSDSIQISIAQLALAYNGKLRSDSLYGMFRQMGHSIPLVFRRGDVEVHRPQLPAQPYPYKTEEVTFTNDAAHATLAGTLTYPVGYKEGNKVPVVLFISGSGQQNRDEELMGHKPFFVIADYLARHGIASLRYDDRGVGQSHGGEVKNATTADFVEDAVAGIDLLRSLGKFGMVGCIGHSEGASMAFMLGTRRKVDFAVSMAGMGMKGDTVLTAQVNRINKLSGQNTAVTVEQYRQIPDIRQVPWLQWFVDYDPSDDIRNTRCPVFALNGDLDCQVISEMNLSAIKSLLPTSADNLVKEYPGLNHLFQHCKTGLPTEYNNIEETISPEVLHDIAQWINSLR